jgi:hypothetical protein
MIDTKKEGYWYSDYEPHYPMPIHSDEIDPNKELILEALLLSQLGAYKLHCKGWSTCRCCGKSNGSVTYSRDGWEWPEGFEHYIREHNIIPTKDFLKEVLGIQDVTMEFESLDSFTIKGYPVFGIKNPSTCRNFKHLIGKEASIDGKKCKIIGVEGFAHNTLHYAGRHICVMVEKME